MTNRRITEYLQLRYSDIYKVEAIVKDANAMLARYRGIDHSNYVFRFDTCGDFALKLYLYAFTITTGYADYMETKEDLLLRIVRIVHDHGAELAVPVSTVHVPEGLRLRGENRAIPPDTVLTGQTPPPTPGHD
jgi:MscS family membrane protein